MSVRVFYKQHIFFCCLYTIWKKEIPIPKFSYFSSVANFIVNEKHSVMTFNDNFIWITLLQWTGIVHA